MFTGKCFTSNDETIVTVDGNFAYLDENDFNQGTHLLQKRWNKCIDVLGDNITFKL